MAPSGQAVPAVLIRRDLIRAIKDSKKTARRAEASGLRQGRRSARASTDQGLAELWGARFVPPSAAANEAF